MVSIIKYIILLLNGKIICVLIYYSYVRNVEKKKGVNYDIYK